ncbi:MAG: HNH endonuclease [Bacteroidales bacterium]
MEIYGNQCAVTGLKVEYKNQKPLLDACHIIPFAESYNDSVRNGIALSPTFHRAFDSGAISISADYRVLVHPALRDQSPFHSLRQYHQQRLYLPGSQRHYPSGEFLRQHREQWGN